jgi:hypothetical protein
VIHSIWVVDRISGRCLFERSYDKKVGEDSLIPSFLSALTSLSESEMEGDRISVLETEGKRWVYRYHDPLIFVITGAKGDPESHLKAQVSYLSDSFLKMFPQLKSETVHEFLKNWSGATSDFESFLRFADQLVGQWSEIGGVSKAAKALDVLEIYQKIFDAIIGRIPRENKVIWNQLGQALEDLTKKLKVSVAYDYSGPKTILDLMSIDVFSVNYESMKSGLAILLTRLVEILKRSLPSGEAERIVRDQVIPLMKREWKRVDVYGIDRVLVSLL